MTTRIQSVRNLADSHGTDRDSRGCPSVSNEGAPRGTTDPLLRPIVTGENPSNNVLIDLDVENQGNLLSNSRTVHMGCAVLDDGFNEFLHGPVGPGLGDTFDSSKFGAGSRESKVSVRWLNGSAAGRMR